VLAYAVFVLEGIFVYLLLNHSYRISWILNSFGFLVDRIVLRYFSITSVCPVNIIPPMLHTQYSVVYHRHQTIVVTANALNTFLFSKIPSVTSNTPSLFTIVSLFWVYVFTLHERLVDIQWARARARVSVCVREHGFAYGAYACSPTIKGICNDLTCFQSSIWTGRPCRRG
jgi:hypothetical protein